MTDTGVGGVDVRGVDTRGVDTGSAGTRGVGLLSPESNVPGSALHAGFLASARAHPDRPALVLADRSLTYAEIDATARQWAAALIEASGRAPRRVGLFAYRSQVSYIGMLAALYAGATVVPLNRTMPPERTRVMLQAADVDVLLVDDASARQVRDVLADRPVPIVAPLSEPATVSDAMGLGVRVLTRADVERAGGPAAPARPAPEDAAYLLFTSGSTGTPKGVPVTHANVAHFLTVNQERYGFTPEDRFSQTFDQTFDLAMFDLFMAWGAGAALVPLQPIQLLSPVRFVNESGLTVWFSVPSAVALLRRRGLLKPNCLPTLRWSLFCGEALPRESAEAWQIAAPASMVENLYGPTEATIACTVHRWRGEESAQLCVNGSVPIGRPYRGLRARILDEHDADVPTGEIGELCIAGPQVFPGYWQDGAQTAQRVLVERAASDGAEVRWYRTGDRAKQLPGGDYACLGRLDSQVKILGYRIELGEVEAALRRLPGLADAAVVDVPAEGDRPVELAAFVTRADGVARLETTALDEGLRELVPAYMVPRTLTVLGDLPVNANGKVDRKALRAQAVAARASGT